MKFLKNKKNILNFFAILMLTFCLFSLNYAHAQVADVPSGSGAGGGIANLPDDVVQERAKIMEEIKNKDAEAAKGNPQTAQAMQDNNKNIASNGPVQNPTTKTLSQSGGQSIMFLWVISILALLLNFFVIFFLVKISNKINNK